MHYLGENIVARIMRRAFIIDNAQLIEKHNRLERMGFTISEINELIYNIEITLGIRIPEEQIYDLHTYGDVLRCVESQLREKAA